MSFLTTTKMALRIDGIHVAYIQSALLASTEYAGFLKCGFAEYRHVLGFGGKLVAYTCSSHKLPPALSNSARVVALPAKC